MKRLRAVVMADTPESVGPVAKARQGGVSPPIILTDTGEGGEGGGGVNAGQGGEGDEGMHTGVWRGGVTEEEVNNNEGMGSGEGGHSLPAPDAPSVCLCLYLCLTPGPVHWFRCTAVTCPWLAVRGCCADALLPTALLPFVTLAAAAFAAACRWRVCSAWPAAHHASHAL